MRMILNNYLGIILAHTYLLDSILFIPILAYSKKLISNHYYLTAYSCSLICQNIIRRKGINLLTGLLSLVDYS